MFRGMFFTMPTYFGNDGVFNQLTFLRVLRASKFVDKQTRKTPQV